LLELASTAGFWGNLQKNENMTERLNGRFSGWRKDIESEKSCGVNAASHVIAKKTHQEGVKLGL